MLYSIFCFDLIELHKLPMLDMQYNQFILSITVNAGMEHSDSDSFQDSMRPAPRLDLNNTRSQPDPSRSNSLMSETSSQPDIHPFFKVKNARLSSNLNPRSNK